jgi:hypothetical protein
LHCCDIATLQQRVKDKGGTFVKVILLLAGGSGGAGLLGGLLVHGVDSME